MGLAAWQTGVPISVQGATIRDDQPDSGYVSLGADAAYASVGLLVVNGAITGSGTLIAPDWVLTAAHLLDAATSGTFTINGTAYTASSFFKNPGWDGNASDGADLGLVHLSSSVLNTPPAFLYTGSAEFGQVGTYVGYGYTGTGLTGWKTLDNQKRAFQNVIDGIPHGSPVLFASDFDNPNAASDNFFGDATPLLLEGCVAPGDSGGGVFITENSQTYLAGVVSYVGAPDGNANSDYGDVSGWGRVSAFAPWIASTVPEPSALAILALGGAAFFITRRAGKAKAS